MKKKKHTPPGGGGGGGGGGWQCPGRHTPENKYSCLGPKENILKSLNKCSVLKLDENKYCRPQNIGNKYSNST